MASRRRNISIINVAISWIYDINISALSAVFSVTSLDIQYKDITFIVITQPNSYHVRRANLFKEHFDEQLRHLQLTEEALPSLHLLHEMEGLQDIIGSWTLFPVFSRFSNLFNKTSWIFICEEDTRIKLPKLLDILKKYDSSKELFLGRELHDSSITIIHHYYSIDNPSSFRYPDFRAGFFLSMPLVNRLSEKLKDLPTAELEFADFSIDPKHERYHVGNKEFSPIMCLQSAWSKYRTFARYLSEKLQISLTHVGNLCVMDSDDCATYDIMRFPKCGKPISDDDLLVAVKTCEKFHKDRIPIVQKTWAKETKHIEYYSETEDSSIPTITLGIPNTERGHCGKTMAIIKKAVTEEKHEDKKWLLIADDDTIISLGKLRLLLACYDASEPVALGERYGYQASKGYGYDYITGGGGARFHPNVSKQKHTDDFFKWHLEVGRRMIFSWPMLKMLAQECNCPSNDSPDDMILGMCLKRLGIAITHTPFIHQARIEDYSGEFLKHRSHVSFHKHWECDPQKTYQILQDDHQTLHDEL